MPGSLNPDALGIPIFFGAVLVEAWVSRRRGRGDGYALGTALSDVACGASYQALELVLKVGVLAVYTVLWEHLAIVRWPDGSAWPWIIGLLGVDFLYYWWHRFSHVVNGLWAVHAVHHQSEDYNFAVALRQPLLEPVTWTPFFAVLAILGVPPELILLSFALDLFYQFWLHTELVDRLPAPIEWVFNTPSHHRVHHGIEARYLDRNYGGVLIVWDRLFGTFEPESARPTYGTTLPLRSYNLAWGNVAHFVRMWRIARTAGRLREKVWTLVAHPAWLPAGAADPETSTLGPRTEKYRPPPPRAAVVHVLAMFAIVSLAMGPLVLFDARLSVTQLGAGAAAVGLTHVAIAGWIERRPWASRVDTIAILTLASAISWLVGSQLSWALGATAGGLTAAIGLLTRPRTATPAPRAAPSA